MKLNNDTLIFKGSTPWEGKIFRGTTLIWPTNTTGSTFVDPNRTIMDDPLPNQIFYKTMSGAVLNPSSDYAIVNSFSDVFGFSGGGPLTLLSNTYDSYGVLTYSAPICSGYPFYQRMAVTAQTVSEVVLPQGMKSVGTNSVMSIPTPYTDPGVVSVFIPEGVEELLYSNQISRYANSLENIVLPRSITHLGVTCVQIRTTGLPNIYYNGTKAEWANISKYQWVSYEDASIVGSFVVHCLDGDIQISS